MGPLCALLISLSTARAEDRISIERNGAYPRVVVQTNGTTASLGCDGIATRGMLRPMMLPDGTARFVCYAGGKGQVVRWTDSEWEYGPTFSEFGLSALVVGGKDFYVARRGPQWYAVWGTAISEAHASIEIGFECRADNWVDDAGGLPLYVSRDPDGYRVHVWGKPPSLPRADKPELACGRKDDASAHYFATGCPNTFPYCTVP